MDYLRDRKQIEELANKLLPKLACGGMDYTDISSFGKYCHSSSGRLGGSTTANTPVAAYQFVLTLAISNHPLLSEIIEDEAVTPETFPTDKLVTAKILKGMKIIDLGCGPAPTYARCTRALGAEVYTVDFNSAEDFGYREDWCYWNPNEKQQKEMEKAHHIQHDLREPDCIDVLLQRTGGNFHVVTAAQVLGDWDWKEKDLYKRKYYGGPTRDQLEKIAMSLLRTHGIFMNHSALVVKES